MRHETAIHQFSPMVGVLPRIKLRISSFYNYPEVDQFLESPRYRTMARLELGVVATVVQLDQLVEISKLESVAVVALLV